MSEKVRHVEIILKHKSSAEYIAAFQAVIDQQAWGAPFDAEAHDMMLELLKHHPHRTEKRRRHSNPLVRMRNRRPKPLSRASNDQTHSFRPWRSPCQQLHFLDCTRDAFQNSNGSDELLDDCKHSLKHIFRKISEQKFIMSLERFFHFWLILSKISAMSIIVIIGFSLSKERLLRGIRGMRTQKGIFYAIFQIVTALLFAFGFFAVFGLAALVPPNL